MSVIYINGNFIDKEKASISVLDHGFLYGDGIFETMRSYNSTIFCLDEHVDRLLKSAQIVFIPVPLSKTEIKNALYTTLQKNNLKNAYIRLTITRGYGEPGLDISLCKKPTIVIYAKPFTPYPEEWYKTGIKIITLSGNNNIGYIKSCNYLTNVLAKTEASTHGAQEAVFITDKGEVTEGVTSNIFMVKNGTLLTPVLNSSILPGITRKKVVDLAKKNGLPIQETTIREKELLSSDECFLTNTGFEIMPVSEIYKKKKWGKCPGDITKRLMEAFNAK